MDQEVSTFPVQVSVVPGSTATAAVSHGTTVGDAIRACGFDASGFTVRSGGRVVGLDEQVAPGQAIILTRQVKGN